LDRLALLVAPLAVGVAVGYGRGGRLRHLAAIRVPGLWLLWVAAGPQAVQFHVEPVRRVVRETVGLPMRVLIYVLPLAWFACYAGRVPRALRLSASVALAGILCNALPILLNGRIPYVGVGQRLGAAGDEARQRAHRACDLHTGEPEVVEQAQHGLVVVELVGAEDRLGAGHLQHQRCRWQKLHSARAATSTTWPVTSSSTAGRPAGSC
jgi:hypothetical protein